MSKESTLKKEVHWLTIVIIILILSGVGYFIYYRYEKAKMRFLMQYLSKFASECVLEYSDYYNVHWLISFSCLMSESEGKRLALSKKRCKGYMQLAGETAGQLRKRLKKTIKDCDIYSTEFNIAGGILHLKGLVENDYYSKGYIIRAIEIYNVGWGNYRRGMRNSKHTKKFTIYWAQFKAEWKQFKKIF